MSTHARDKNVVEKDAWEEAGMTVFTWALAAWFFKQLFHLQGR